MNNVHQCVICFAYLLCLFGAEIGHAQSGAGRGMMERFQMLDADTNGQVSTAEAAEWHETVFLAMDADDDRKLDRKEYMAVQMGRGADPEQRGPRYAKRQAEKDARFTEMDADGDGYITYEQFMANGQRRFAAADTDESGSVSMAEFRAARRR